MLKENNTYYSFAKENNCLIKCCYYWRHNTTNTIGKTFIYLINGRGLEKLIDYWNTRAPETWVYSLTPLEKL